MNQASSCCGKKQHESWSAAERVLKGLRGIDREGAVRLQVYRCRHCGFYHLGNTSVARYRQRKPVLALVEEEEE